MAKPKAQPAVSPSPSETPAPKSAELLKAEKEKLAQEQEKIKANRLAEIEAVSQKISTVFSELEKVEGKRGSLLWDLVDRTSEAVAEAKLVGTEVLLSLKTAYSKVKGIPLEEFKIGGKGANDLSLLSKIKKLATATGEEAAKIARLRAEGHGFNAVDAALHGREPGTRTKNEKGPKSAGSAASDKDKDKDKPKGTFQLVPGDEPNLILLLRSVIRCAVEAGFNHAQIHNLFLASNAEMEAEALASLPLSEAQAVESSEPTDA